MSEILWIKAHNKVVDYLRAVRRIHQFPDEKLTLSERMHRVFHPDIFEEVRQKPSHTLKRSLAVLPFLEGSEIRSQDRVVVFKLFSIRNFPRVLLDTP